MGIENREDLVNPLGRIAIIRKDLVKTLVGDTAFAFTFLD